MGFPHSSVGKESAYDAGDPVRFLGREDALEEGRAAHSSIPAWRIPERGAWQATVHGVAENQTGLRD